MQESCLQKASIVLNVLNVWFLFSCILTATFFFWKSNFHFKIFLFTKLQNIYREFLYTLHQPLPWIIIMIKIMQLNTDTVLLTKLAIDLVHVSPALSLVLSLVQDQIQDYTLHSVVISPPICDNPSLPWLCPFWTILVSYISHMDS